MRIINADVLDGLAQLESESVHCVVTSPPYFGLRDYGIEGQIGLEPTPDAYVAKMVEVFREVRRVLRKDGTCWLNLGDSYASTSSGGGAGQNLAALADKWAPSKTPRNPNRQDNGTVKHAPKTIPFGLKPKDLIGIPWRVAFALQADGWWLRQDIIWSKPNPMPESVTDRCTKAHEYLFMLTKAERYFYDHAAVAEDCVKVGTPGHLQSGANSREHIRRTPAGKNESPGVGRRQNGFNARWNESEADGTAPLFRNKRSVWEVATSPFPEAHFATFPPALIEPCIKAGCPKGGTVLDPFGGSGTTGLVADRLGRNSILIELNPEYAAMAQRRISNDCPMFAQVS